MTREKEKRKEAKTEREIERDTHLLEQGLVVESLDLQVLLPGSRT
jgi:hypothetical protein